MFVPLNAKCPLTFCIALSWLGVDVNFRSFAAASGAGPRSSSSQCVTDVLRIIGTLTEAGSTSGCGIRHPSNLTQHLGFAVCEHVSVWPQQQRQAVWEACIQRS